MACYNVAAVLINNRTVNATEVQEVLTKYGCMIKTRLGLHEAGNACSDNGLLILQLCGDKAEVDNMLKELNAIQGVKAKNIELNAD